MHYEKDDSIKELLPIKKKCGLIVTMNATEDFLQNGYNSLFEKTANTVNHIFGSCETLYSCDTYQFDDYSKYYAAMFDEKHKAAHKEIRFPIDLNNAFELGKRVAEQ